MTTILLILGAIGAVLLYLGFIYRAPDMTAYDSPDHEPVIEEHEVSAEHNDVLEKLAAYHQNPTVDVEVGRRKFEDFFSVEVDIEIKPVDVHGIPSEWVLADGADPDRRLLYIHGGAFTVGSPKTHRFITSELSKRAGTAVLAIDYRKIPEFRTTRCHEDARIAYKWILENGPEGKSEAEQLFVAGDSAGGNLTLAVIAWAKNQGLQQADGAVALAPLTDATLSSPSLEINKDTDPFLGPSVGRMLKVPRPVLAIFSRLRNGLPSNHPELSPLFGDLSDLPPTLIQVSRHEMLYDDAKRYANKAKAEGGDVTLQVWPKLVHVFQGFANLPEAHHALDRIADFIKGKDRKKAEAA